MIQSIVYFQNSLELPKIGLVAFNVFVLVCALNIYSIDCALGRVGQSHSKDIGRISKSKELSCFLSRHKAI